MRAWRPFRDPDGFTLIEVMVALSVLVVGVLGAVALVGGASQRTAATKAREGATNLARQLAEAAQALPYAQITPTSIVSLLQAQPGLGDYGAGAGWTIQRRGITYTVTASACTLDDPEDGVGTHDSTFCSDTATNSPHPADDIPEDYKRVTVDVAWSTPGPTSRDVKLTTLINNPGDPAGPKVTSLTLTSPGSSTITSPAVTAASFHFVTSPAATTTNWSVDGNVKSPTPSGSGTSWDFTWPLGTVDQGANTYGTDAVVDGTYTISASAYDTGGASAGPRALTVSLNRLPPLAPAGLTGGWNGSTVDFEWLPNSEGDISSYRVYRHPSSGADVLVCTATTTTTCQDQSPPSQSSLDYYVVAVDTAPGTGAPRQGVHSSTITVTQGNQPPNPPTNLVATAQGNATVLSWDAASPADPDGGGIAFYRIYRDGQLFANRYDRTDTGTTTTYTDTNTGGLQHTYWVTAVDPQLAESSFLGPVTR